MTVYTARAWCPGSCFFSVQCTLTYYWNEQLHFTLDLHSATVWEPTAYNAHLWCTGVRTHSVHCTCIVHHCVNLQCILHFHIASVIALAVYNARVQCTGEFRDSVPCTFIVHHFVNWQCVLQVHSASFCALTVCTASANFFFHTGCVIAVSCAPLLDTGSAKWAAGLPGACVECTIRAPRVPATNRCAEALPKISGICKELCNVLAHQWGHRTKLGRAITD